jgi:gas vesicle protein
MAHRSSIMTDVFMLVGGSVVGAGIGLLLAPQSGAKSRKEIARFGRTVGKKSERFYHDVADGMSDFADTVGGKMAFLHKR